MATVDISRLQLRTDQRKKEDRLQYDPHLQEERSRAGASQRWIDVIARLADPGKAGELFAPLVQRDENRTGFGLGLAIALQAAQAHNGTVSVRNVAGKGCVFTIDLPATGAPTRGGDAQG